MAMIILCILNGSLETDFDRGFNLPMSKNKKGKRLFPIKVALNIKVAHLLRSLRNGHSQTEIYLNSQT